MAFTFKQFHIDDHGCGMKVSTDAVLLGAFAKLEQAKTILDLGAGSGVLSLMAAQRSDNGSKITAIELDPIAAKACQLNMTTSPWHDRLCVINQSVQNFCHSNSDKKFEHIICNPPYFEHGPLANESSRAIARHTQALTFEDLFLSIQALLALHGLCTLIFPVQSMNKAKQAISAVDLHITEQCEVASVDGKAASRVLLTLSHQASMQQVSPTQLFIRDKQGSFSPEMARLCQDFYLKL